MIKSPFSSIECLACGRTVEKVLEEDNSTELGGIFYDEAKDLIGFWCDSCSKEAQKEYDADLREKMWKIYNTFCNQFEDLMTDVVT